jgi:hypothetical protein
MWPVGSPISTLPRSQSPPADPAMKKTFFFVAGPIVPLGALVALAWVAIPEAGHLSDPSWAGTYYAGHSYGSHTLSITAAGRFTELQTGCLQHDEDSGTVEDTDGRLRLQRQGTSRPRNDPQDYWRRWFPPEYVMVRWGKRRYLVPPGEILEFCAAVHGGCEPRNEPRGFFLLQRGDETIEPETDEPQLPNGFQKYLRLEQLDVAIKSLSQPGAPAGRTGAANAADEPYSVTLDAGSHEGVLPGMRFHKLPEPTQGGMIVIRETSDHESKGILIDWQSGHSPKTPPQAGDRFRAPSPWACNSLTSRIFPFSGQLTIDGHPPQGEGKIIVMLVDRKTRSDRSQFTVCRPSGEFSFSSFGNGDGAHAGTYVVVIARLKLQGIYGFAGPDKLNNLYNDPDVNGRRPGFVIEHKRPGKTDYVFELKIRGVRPIERPGPRALTEFKN